MSRPAPAVVHACIALLCVVWGSTWLVIAEGLRDLPPFTSLTIRFALAAGVFALLAPRLSRWEGGARPPLWLSASMGVGTLAIPYALLYWAETIIPSGVASVLWAVFPILMAVSAHFALPDERLGGRNVAGLALGFGGVALLFSTDLDSMGSGAVVAGAVYLIAPVLSTVSNTLVKRHGSAASSVLLNRDGLCIATALLVPFALLTERGAPIAWTGRAVFSIGYLALAGTVLTFGVYHWCLRWAPARELALISYVIPVVALTLGAALGGERFGLGTVAGTGLVLLGVALARHRPRE